MTHMCVICQPTATQQHGGNEGQRAQTFRFKTARFVRWRKKNRRERR